MIRQTTVSTKHIGSQEVMETAMRRALKVELTEIGELLHHSPMQDTTTKKVRTWHRDFTIKLEGEVNAAIRDLFIKRLQGILVDPILEEPLDAQARLGRDGNPYTRAAYGIWRHTDPEAPKLSFRSLKPHFVARKMIEWLGRHNAQLSTENLEAKYVEVLKQKRAMFLERSEREEFRQSRRNPFAQQRANLEEERRLRREITNEILARDEAERNRIREEIAQLEEEIRADAERIAELRQNQAQTDQLLSEAERERINTEIAITETRKAIKQQKKARLKKVAIAAAAAAACVAATACVAYAGGVQFAATPTNGGAQVTIAVSI